MNNLKAINTLMILAFLVIVSACKKEETMTDPMVTFRQVIDEAGGFDDPSQNEESTVTDVYSEDRDGATWECTTETVSIQQGAGGNTGFSLFSPNASVIYPGNMLQGNSLSDATPKIISVERAGGTISTDVVDGNIQSSFEVDEIDKSSVTEAINSIIGGSTGIVPANFDISIRNIQSREQFALELGLEVNTTFTDLEAKLNYSSDTEKNTFILNLNQSFYTMSFDIPTSLDDLFAPSVTPDDLTRYVGPNNPACYISDVTYGRIFYMLVQSSSSVTEMDAALNASFNGVTNQVDGSVETEYLSTLDELSISVFAYGGLAGTSLLTIGTTDLNELAVLLSESSNIGSGKPISYVVRSVYDNQIVSTQLATQYDVTNCKPVGADGAPPYTEHWTGNVVSAMGPVGAAFSRFGTEFILINKDGDQFMRSTTGVLEGPFPISQLGTEPLPFNGVGAACNIDGNETEDGWIQIFDASGTQYAYLRPNGAFGIIHPITDMAIGTGPFNLTGIGAAAFVDKDSQGPARRLVFNKPGDKVSIYTNNPNEFGTVYTIHSMMVHSPERLPIDEVGASIGFYIGDDRYYILFNGAGTKYIIRGSINGGPSTGVIGPFDL